MIETDLFAIYERLNSAWKQSFPNFPCPAEAFWDQFLTKFHPATIEEKMAFCARVGRGIVSAQAYLKTSLAKADALEYQLTLEREKQLYPPLRQIRTEVRYIEQDMDLVAKLTPAPAPAPTIRPRQRRINRGLLPNSLATRFFREIGARAGRGVKAAFRKKIHAAYRRKEIKGSVYNGTLHLEGESARMWLDKEIAAHKAGLVSK